MSLIQHHRFHQNWFHQFGFMILFPRWPVTGLFRISKLYSMPRVTGWSFESDILTREIKVHALSRNIFRNSIWTSVAQDIVILPRCLVQGWILEEAGTLNWRDHISWSTANLSMIFGHRIHQDFIFGSFNFQLLRLLQYQNIATVPKLSSFSI